MSTLPVLASKGEKGKSKYQSLDINSLYRVSRGESLEKQQQKSTLPLKHGMQSLGRVPSARRPPANLPSIKSEHSGTDAAVSLVPSGGPGWGKHEIPTTTTTATSTPPTQTPPVPNSTVNSPSPANIQLSAHQAAIAIPVTTTIPPPTKHIIPSATPATTDKSWSSVMTGNDLIHPPPYQSPQFQHEFPSLSSGDGGPPRTGTDTQYGPGPSLRPQTEGSWMQGGSRASSDGPPRNNSAPLGPPPQLSAQVGLVHQQPLPPQYHGILPQFMYRGNFPSNGHGSPSTTNIPPTVSNNARNRIENRQPPSRPVDNDEVARRPIIKEEDLSRMDDMTKDMGWAAQDEIDYNQKLAFSDDENVIEKGTRKTNRQVSKEQEKTENYSHEVDLTKGWCRTGNSAPIIRGRSTDEDEILAQKRRQQHQVLLSAAEKAKQRKEEEEKRYLEAKINKGKREKDQDEIQGTISPSTVPPQPIAPVPMPIPDWEKDRDKRPRNEPNEEKNSTVKSHESAASDFHQLTQIEGRNFVRKEPRNNERDREIRERNGPGFNSRQLPPRLQKKQQLRNNSSPQPSMNYSQSYDTRWMSNNQSASKTSPTSINRKGRPEWESSEKERDDDRMRYINEDIHRGTNRSYPDSGRKSSSDNRYSDEGRESRNQNYEYKKNKDESKWEKSREKFNEKEDIFDDHNINRQSTDDWHSERHDKYNRDDKDKYERPQRPDSRDSRTSRDSRHSRESTRDNEPREHHLGSWAESMVYEDKKKDHLKEDRRSVPGPITKEKIEADEKQNEKRNLTQLKRGSIPEKKPEILEEKPGEKEHDSWNIRKKDNINDNILTAKAWADDVSQNTVSPENLKVSELEKSNKLSSKIDLNKKEIKQEETEGKKCETFEVGKDRDDKRGQGHNINRNRSDPQNNRPQGWERTSGGGVVYNSWYKKPRGSRSGRPSKDWHGTDSDASTDEVSISTDGGKNDRALLGTQRSPKPGRRNDKDDKKFERDSKNDKGINDRKNDKYQDGSKRENYEPRGEPSRHGRGGTNIRSRGGGLSKRIDGYGPPPSKSPFGHNEDKKHMLEEVQTENLSSDEKCKSSNQQGNAGVIGSTRKELPSHQPRIERRNDDKFDRNKPRRTSDNRKSKPKSKDDNCDTSDHSDDSANKLGRKMTKSPQRTRGPNINSSRRNNQPPRLSGDKRAGSFNQGRNESMNIRQNSSGSLRSAPSGKIDAIIDEKSYDINPLCSAIADIPLKNKDCERNDDNENVDGEVDDKNSAQGDSDGFQEVKSKKAVKERLKTTEDKPPMKALGKCENNLKLDRKGGKSATAQLSQQQIASIPSLMDTPINPPAIIPQPINKNQYDRLRQKLPPRLAKQRENSRLQKAQMQHGMCDINDLNKVNQNLNLYGLKDTSAQGLPLSNAWEKPLSTQLRGIEQDSVLSVGIENCKSLEQPHSPSQNNSPISEKVIGKNNQIQDKSVLDGTTPPVKTIIFENTNFKSAPGVRPNRNDKPRLNKMEDGSANMDNSVMSGFNKPITDLLNKNDKQADIQMQLTFNKEDSADIKLDFFDSEISHLTDDKSSKNLAMPRSMHSITSSNSTISPSTADLNFKIASVKKVWENTMPPVMEHNVVQDDNNSSFSTSFGPDPNSLDHSGAFSKGTETADDCPEGYSPSPNQSAPNSTTNVCKVKPTQQVPGTTGQNVAGVHQQHSGMITSALMGPLSPPPIQPVIGPNVGLSQPPQQYTANQHIGYQTGLGGSNQYGMSAIPSPPALVFNSTQQLQPQAGLYGGFSIDQLGGQRGSQYSQYANHYGLGQTGSSPYSTQSLYLQTAQPHPPPAAPAPQDIYQGISNFRLQNTGPFGQNPQNPSTVLISSSSNSLMSATVKPSSQQISAIGTKTGGVGQAFQQQSQQGQQLYMAYDPSMQPNYIQNPGVLQRGPGGPVQNNVGPTLQPSSSFYSGTTGAQSGYYQQPGNSNVQSAPLQQHQAGYGLQGNVFGTHNQSHTSPGLQNFGFLSQMQIAAAINAQQFRSPNMQNASYMKGIVNQQVGDQSGRSQQLKSPGTQQEVLSSVFSSGPQIPSPKSRQNCKQPPPQPSPTTQHKYNLYQTVGNQQSSQVQRYPTPIQRPPMNFQPPIGSMQNNGSNNQKHRVNSGNKGPSRQYYTPQGGGLTSQNEKSDDSKLGDNGTSNTSNSTNSSSSNIVSKTTIGNVTTTAVNQTPEITKDINKEESSAMKD